MGARSNVLKQSNTCQTFGTWNSSMEAICSRFSVEHQQWHIWALVLLSHLCTLRMEHNMLLKASMLLTCACGVELSLEVWLVSLLVTCSLVIDKDYTTDGSLSAFVDVTPNVLTLKNPICGHSRWSSPSTPTTNGHDLLPLQIYLNKISIFH